MYRFTRCKLLTLSTVLIALGIEGAAETPVQAADTWSTPVLPPVGCGSFSGVQPNAVAVNAAGELALVGSFQTGTAFTVQICTSEDGVHWSGPSTIGQGVQPAVAIAPDGRIVVVWQWTSGVLSNTEASVRAPGGSFSPPVVVSPNTGRPVVGMDGSGNAVAAWAHMNLSQPVETASLPAGGRWTAVHTLAAQGGGVNLAVNSVGGAILTWRSAGLIAAASGTIQAGFGPSVQVGKAYGALSEQISPHVALNDAGAAFLAWDSHDNNEVVSRTADGTWSAPTKLSGPTPSGIRIAVDGAGNAVAAFSETIASGNPTYASVRPAGGSWGPPVLLSALTDTGHVSDVVGDGKGTFVVAWTSGTGVAPMVDALTIAPGGGLGPSTAVGSAPFMTVKIVPGHAVMWMGAGLYAGAGISTETVQ
jgi:hypothetical protein